MDTASRRKDSCSLKSQTPRKSHTGTAFTFLHGGAFYFLALSSSAPSKQELDRFASLSWILSTLIIIHISFHVKKSERSSSYLSQNLCLILLRALLQCTFPVNFILCFQFNFFLKVWLWLILLFILFVSLWYIILALSQGTQPLFSM